VTHRPAAVVTAGHTVDMTRAQATKESKDEEETSPQVVMAVRLAASYQANSTRSSEEVVATTTTMGRRSAQWRHRTCCPCYCRQRRRLEWAGREAMETRRTSLLHNGGRPKLRVAEREELQWRPGGDAEGSAGDEGAEVAEAVGETARRPFHSFSRVWVAPHVAGCKAAAAGSACWRTALVRAVEAGGGLFFEEKKEQEIG